MGSEIGQFKEWDYKGQIEWFLLDYPAHAMLQLYSARLNHLYLETPALWERDDSWQGFGWIDADNRDMSVLSYRVMEAVVYKTASCRQPMVLGAHLTNIFHSTCQDTARFFCKKYQKQKIQQRHKGSFAYLQISKKGALLCSRKKNV